MKDFQAFSIYSIYIFQYLHKHSIKLCYLKLSKLVMIIVYCVQK